MNALKRSLAFLLLLTSAAFAQETAQHAEAKPTVGPAAFAHIIKDFAVPPRVVIEGKTFTETVVVTEDGVGYKGCTFRMAKGEGWRHCVKIQSGVRFTQFVDCDFSGADSKGLVGEFMAVYGSRFHDLGEDGIFVTEGGHADVIGCEFWDLGWLPGAHSDPFQVVVGSDCRFLGNRVVVPHEGDIGGRLSNSCVYVKSVPALGPPPERILIARNILDGGLYSVRITASPGAPLPSDVVVRGNRFVRHYYKAYTADAGLAWTIPLVEEHNDMSMAVRYRP